MEFRTPDEAAFAIEALNGHQFDTRHVFYCNRFTDIEKFANLDETYVEPKVEEFVPRVCVPYDTCIEYVLNIPSQEHLRAWLGDPMGRDQYVTYRGDDVEIHWHGKPSQCEIAYSKLV